MFALLNSELRKMDPPRNYFKIYVIIHNLNSLLPESVTNYQIIID